MKELLELTEKKQHYAIVFVVSARDIRFFLSMNAENDWDEREYFRSHTSFLALFPHGKSVHLTPYPENNNWRLSLFSRRDMLKTANAFLKKWTITDVDDGDQFVFYFKEVN